LSQSDPRPLVLIVQSEPAIARILVLLLHELACRTLVTADIAQAHERIDEHEGELSAVIVDDHVDGGSMLIERIRGEPDLASLPVLLMGISGRPQGYPASAFMPMPFTPATFVQAFCRITGLPLPDEYSRE
jgi:CheY-like chemotaxis protein